MFLSLLLLAGLLLLCPMPGLAQTQQPPPPGGETAYGIVCDGVTQVAAAIQHLLDTVPLGSRVVLPPGSCMLNATLTITRSLTLAGAGMDQTVLRQTVANIPVVTVSVINVHVTGMTLLHTGTPVAGGDGLIVRSPTGTSLQAVTITDVSASWNWRGFVLGCMAYAQAAHVWAQKNNSHGFEFLYDASPGCGVDQWDIVHAISQLNLGAGFYGYNTAFEPGIGPWLTQTVSFGNNQGGYVFRGSSGFGLYDLRLHNVLSSADNVYGIYLDTWGNAHMISEPWIELTGTLGGLPQGSAGIPSTASNTGHCLELGVNNGEGITVSGGLYWNCAWSGVALAAPYSHLIGGSSLGNGRALDATPARRAGVHIGGAGVLVSGHTFTFPGTGTLAYIDVAAAVTNAVIGLNSYAPGLAVPNAPPVPTRRGQVTIAETAATATVLLTPAEADVAYFVQLTPASKTGAPAVGAYTITGVTKATGNFQVAVSTAPGAGTSVVYDWLLYR